MKARVIKPFFDKFTSELYSIGSVVDFDDDDRTNGCVEDGYLELVEDKPKATKKKSTAKKK